MTASDGPGDQPGTPARRRARGGRRGGRLRRRAVRSGHRGCACTRGSSPRGVPEGTRQLSRVTRDDSRDRIEGAGPWVPGTPSPERFSSGGAQGTATTTTENAMSLSTTPAPARTDVAAPPPDAPVRRRPPPGWSAPAAWPSPAARLPGPPASLAFDLTPGGRHGRALVYEVIVAAVPARPGRAGRRAAAHRATGTGRLARGFLHAEHVLLGLAIASTLTWMFARRVPRTGWFLALDVFWPLSMLGMAAIGIRIAIAGRWKGAARFWPLVAESWAPVIVPGGARCAAVAPRSSRAGAPAVGYAVPRRRSSPPAGADRRPRLTWPPRRRPASRTGRRGAVVAETGASETS